MELAGRGSGRGRGSRYQVPVVAGNQLGPGQGLERGLVPVSSR